MRVSDRTRLKVVFGLMACLLILQLFNATSPLFSAEEPAIYSTLIFICDADGSNLMPLTTFGDYLSQGSPCWTADSKRVAFDAYKPQLGQSFYDGHIILVDADGSNPRDLGVGILPSLSPKGNRVAFCRHERVGAKGVYVMDLNDPDTIALIDEKGWGAEWSPDGRYIAYRKGPPLRLYDVIEGTYRPAFDPEKSGIAGVDWNYSWSPDSRRIAFKANTVDNKHALAIATIDDENQKAQIVYEGEMGPAVTWNPIQDEIVIERMGSEPDYFQTLFRVSLSKPGMVTQLKSTPVNRRMRNASFSPDGKKIAISVYARQPGDK